MKNLKFAPLSLLAGVVLLTSCSTTSCFNPCNWRPNWKSPCKQSSQCCDYQTSYNNDSGYEDYGYGEYSDDNNDGNYLESNGYVEVTDQEMQNIRQTNYMQTPGQDMQNVRQTNYMQAPVQDQSVRQTNNSYSPYPNTSVEDVSSPLYKNDNLLDSKDTPYYDEQNVGTGKKNTRNDNTSIKQKNLPVQEDIEETPSIQKQDLDKIRSAHQRVLDRYKQRKQQETASQDSDYFDQVVKKVISKEKKNQQ